MVSFAILTVDSCRVQLGLSDAAMIFPISLIAFEKMRTSHQHIQTHQSKLLIILLSLLYPLLYYILFYSILYPPQWHPLACVGEAWKVTLPSTAPAAPSTPPPKPTPPRTASPSWWPTETTQWGRLTTFPLRNLCQTRRTSTEWGTRWRRRWRRCWFVTCRCLMVWPWMNSISSRSICVRKAIW